MPLRSSNLAVLALALASCGSPPASSGPIRSPANAEEQAPQAEAPAKPAPKAEETPALFTATALKGPFESLAAYCEPHLVPKSDGSRNQCDTSAASIDALQGNTSWLLSLGTFTFFDYENDDEPSVHLAFETQRGWFVLERFEREFNRYQWSIDKAEIIGERLVLWHANDQGRFESQLYKYISVCGLGDAGAPGCVGPYKLYDSYTGYEGSKEHGESLPEEVALHCEAEFASGDVLRVLPKDDACQAATELVGEHQLHFP